MQAKRLIILISGSGTNLQAIMDAITAGTLNAEIVCVISNRKAAYGLERARQAGIPTLYSPLKPYTDAGKSREVYDADLAEKIDELMPDLIILAGWMHIFSPRFLDHFDGKVINLHPALPEAFAGTHAIERAYEAHQCGEIEHSGCMVHYVVPEVDAGEVILQEIVPFEENDTLEAFEIRLHAAEHRTLVQAIRQLIAQ